VWTLLAPVDAGTDQRSGVRTQCGEIDAKCVEPRLTEVGQRVRAVDVCQNPTLDHGGGHGNAKAARDVVVAGACGTHGRCPRAFAEGANRHRRRYASDGLEGISHIGVGELKEAVPAVVWRRWHGDDQAAIDKLRQMDAGSGWGHAGLACQSAGRQCSAIVQSKEDTAPAGIGEEGRDG
jgi:hypothetical protein